MLPDCCALLAKKGLTVQSPEVRVLSQAGLLMVLEERLYAGEHSVEMYPAYLVLLTSMLGAAVTTRLSGTGRIAPLTSYALHCIFASKLTMLLVPQVCLQTCQMLWVSVQRDAIE